MTTVRDARELIAEIQSVRHDVAERVNCSPAWRIASATLIGTTCAAQAAPPSIGLPIAAGCFVGIGVMAFVARKRMGFFVNGYRKGRTRKVALSLFIAFEFIYFTSLWLKESRHLGWAPVVGGAIIVPIVIFAGYRWQAAYRSEFGSDGATRGR